LLPRMRKPRMSVVTCRKIQKALPGLLLDSELRCTEAREHLTQCTHCAAELASIQATVRLLDHWAAPDPGPFFDTRLHAHLRAERTSDPAGFLERWRAWILYSSNIRAPLWRTVGVAVLLTIGCGTFTLLQNRQAPVEASLTVRDLQCYECNAQVIQQLSFLDSDEEGPSQSMSGYPTE
jgi:anti-sigma factor RsiW